ncbi:hypothetical protein LX36DRAFT_234499 [Colletotrichum falcatum]|nr:hypothetical protein LX36DRAFT_234499 [Colletotrichum falcatum]
MQYPYREFFSLLLPKRVFKLYYSHLLPSLPRKKKKKKRKKLLFSAFSMKTFIIKALRLVQHISSAVAPWLIT